MKEPLSSDDRAQAFTLEGFIGGLLILAAVLFALQATVMTPTSSGSSSEETQLALQRQASDVLATTAASENNSLSYYVRYWDVDRLTFVGGKNLEVGYGTVPPPGTFGNSLETVFAQQGHSYNVLLTYMTPNSSNRGRVWMVYQGKPPASAVAASRTVTLYDGMTLTDPDSANDPLVAFDTEPYDGDDGYYPVPDAAPNSTVYNVVEVRLIVW